ncbi:hypothetical protein FEM48_Zijuj01G0023400 [Ziziphus jujuba var. spinosa]|nr:hypothetical protein FEM48_Zijuj01G0023400 [Ziziphus jujuba var. spinosa]
MIICYNKTIHHQQGMWQIENPTDQSLPLFDLQLSLILSLCLLLMFAFKALGLPRISAEMFGGFILGPSLLGKKRFFFPFKSLLTLETIGNLSLIYYLFLVGLEVDLKPVLRAGKKPLSIALIGILIPMPIGYALHSMLNMNEYGFDDDDIYSKRIRYGPLFWGVALATTNFPDLAWILSDIKLLHVEVGRVALSSAIITDLLSWLLLVLSTAIAGETTTFTLVYSIIFVGFCLLVLRPLLAWLISRDEREDQSGGGRSYDELHLYYLLAAVPFFGFITDSIGCQSMLGAFMLGVIMPKGVLKKTLMEKVEDFVCGLMMPLFFLIIGLRTNIHTLFGGDPGFATIVVIIFLAFGAKVLSTFLAAVFLNNMSSRDGLALGFLMNTKGLVSLIIINTARDLKALTNQSFSAMILAFWVMTTAVNPILSKTYKPIKNLSKYKRITIDGLKEDSEFRILTCIHNPRNISSFVNLLEASNPTKQSPICTIAVHLVENTGRASAMLILNDACKISEEEINGLPPIHFMNSFEKLEARNKAITVQQLSAVSSYSTVHKDICSLAEDKKVSLIVVPFHKQSTNAETILAPGEKKGYSPFRDVNRNVMNNAQCSVAIFVDRGLSSLVHKHPVVDGEDDDKHRVQRHYYMFFIGGPDDHEALAYAWRMSKDPRASLSVIRFVPSELGGVDHNHQNLHDKISIDNQKDADDEFIKQFKFESRNSPNIQFLEKVVDKSDDVMKVIGNLEDKCDIFFVGRGRGTLSPLMKVLSDWMEFPELGPLGDFLVSSSFIHYASVLIIQQGDTSIEDEEEACDQGQLKEHAAGRMTLSVPEVETPEFAPFVHRRGRSMRIHDQ